MDQRYTSFAMVGARSLGDYNRIARSKDLDPKPLIVIVIDELADIMFMAPDEAERALCRIAQMSRATGIHLVIATQRPSTDVVTGLIKANFPARISFAVTSQVDSRVILDSQGAEKLLGRGDMLFMAPDSAKLTRIQGCFASDKELEALAAFWRRTVVKGGTEAEESPPWDAASREEGDFRDPLLEKAIELVRKHERASASFLQRKMRIGYPRAGRIIDQLERLGIVGQSESGGRSRVVLDKAPAGGEKKEPSAEEREA
jgi:S-DNA-T family DNA segregation ATPase FtsK/SpoIIIE